MISVIVPFFNAEKSIEAAIKSVLDQSYEDLELLLINDGSIDQSKEIASSFDDKRIRCFEQENKGVAAARNIGLINMKGDYFCFLDADDVFSKASLHSRFNKFEKNPELSFVDGQVILMDSELKGVYKSWHPELIGNPFIDLIRKQGKSFFGLTWMVKRNPNYNYYFHEGLTHGEDLLFYLELARKGGIYGFVNQPILKYRDTPNSAMKNLKGLEHGYRYIESEINKWKEIDQKDFGKFKYKWRRAMFLSYVQERRVWDALTSIY